MHESCMHILQALCNTDYIASYRAHPPDASLARMIGFLLRCSVQSSDLPASPVLRFTERLICEAAVQPFEA